MRRTAPLLTLLALACGRELALSEPPTPAPAAEEEIFLGPLSGYWVGALVLDDGEGTFELPLPILLGLVDLEPPSGASDGPVIGLPLRGDDSLFFVGRYDGRGIHLPVEGGEHTIERAPGGGELSFGPLHQVCPGGPPRELRLSRLCAFDPALSGIYEGEELACDGSERSPARVALATADDTLVGMFWPETDWALLVGDFDPFAVQLGGLSVELDKLVASGDEDPTAFHPTLVTLAEEAGVLRLSLERLSPDGTTCERRLELSRPAGTASERCRFDALEGERHELHARWIELPEGPRLGVDLSDSLGRVLPPEATGCFGATLATLDGQRAEPREVPAELPLPGSPSELQPRPSFLFDVGPLPAGRSASLELFVAATCDLSRRLPIEPRCLTIDGAELYEE